MTRHYWVWRRLGNTKLNKIWRNVTPKVHFSYNTETRQQSAEVNTVRPRKRQHGDHYYFKVHFAANRSPKHPRLQVMFGEIWHLPNHAWPSWMASEIENESNGATVLYQYRSHQVPHTTFLSEIIVPTLFSPHSPPLPRPSPSATPSLSAHQLHAQQGNTTTESPRSDCFTEWIITSEWKRHFVNHCYCHTAPR